MEDRIYTIDDLYEGKGKRDALIFPGAWKAFLVEMKDRHYGQEPFNDAWGWFSMGWIASMDKFLKLVISKKYE